MSANTSDPSGSKRRRDDGDNAGRRVSKARKYLPAIQGPGVFVTCVRGKESPAANEMKLILEKFAPQSQEAISVEETNTDPPEKAENKEDLDQGQEQDDIAKEIEEELASIKRPEKHPLKSSFMICDTSCECLVFIKMPEAMDPVSIITSYLEDVFKSGTTQSKYICRVLPMQKICPADMASILTAAQELLSCIPRDVSFRVEYKARSHGDKVSRMDCINEIAAELDKDKNISVQLKNSDYVLLVEIFKHVAGLALVRQFDHYRKFNTQEVASLSNLNSSKTIQSRIESTE